MSGDTLVIILAALTSALLLTGQEGRAQLGLSGHPSVVLAGMLEEGLACAMERIHTSGGTGVVFDFIYLL